MNSKAKIGIFYNKSKFKSLSFGTFVIESVYLFFV